MDSAGVSCAYPAPTCTFLSQTPAYSSSLHQLSPTRTGTSPM